MLNEDVINNAHVINNFILNILSPSEDYRDYMFSLMNIGITKNDYELNKLETSKRVFVGNSLSEKVDCYFDLLKIHTSKKEIDILKNLMKEFALDEINSDEDFFYKVSEKLKCDKDITIAKLRFDKLSYFYMSHDVQIDKQIIAEGSKCFSSKIILNLNQSLISEVDIYTINKLIEGYEKFKENKKFFNKKADQYVKSILDENILEISKYAKHIENQAIKDGCYSDILQHLRIEAKCLKFLGLTNPSILRIVLPLVKQIIKYRDRDVRCYFLFNIIEYNGKTLELFLSKLLEISNGRKNILLSLVLIFFNISKDTQEKLYEILKIRNKNNLFSKALFVLFLKLKKINSINDEQKANVIVNIFSLSSGTEDEILNKIDVLICIIKINKDFIKQIKEFSFLNLLSFLIKPLVIRNFISDIDENRLKFFDTFMKSRIP